MSKIKRSDPFADVIGRPVEEPSCAPKLSKPSGNTLRSQLSTIEENTDDIELHEIHSNTYCRLMYDAPRCFPGLASVLPINCFTKLYSYPDLEFENFPDKEDSYNVCE